MKTHLYRFPDGRTETHPGLRANCSICMCDHRYAPTAKSSAVQALIDERRGWLIRSWSA